MTSIPQCRRSGTTLAEVVISSLFVGVVLVASLETVSSAIRSSRTASDLVNANLLAEQMFCEMMSLPYEDPEEETSGLGLEAGEGSSLVNREAADDVDDLDGWSKSPPEHPDGTPMTGFDGWTREVRVDYLFFDPTPDGKLAYWGSENGVKLVVVDIDGPDGIYVQRQAVRSIHGVAEGEPALDETMMTAVRASIVAGDSGEVTTSIDMTNEVGAP